MKRTFCFLVLSLLLAGVGWAEEKDKDKGGLCPKTKMLKNCLSCHVVPTFRIKEARPDAHLNYPNGYMKIVEGQPSIGYFLLQEIDAEKVKDFFEYLDRHKIKKAVVEIYSPGGSLFGAQRIITLMQDWQSRGGEIETRVNGFAASAGFLIFVAGDKGKRFAGAQADLMWHELLSFKFLDISTPSDKEEEARILRHLQNTRNEWLATRGNLSKKEIDELVRKKEFWMSGKQAIEYGFADGIIGEKGEKGEKK